jgi:hypothetical protein
MGTLAYGSTRETEKIAGATFVEVAPLQAGVNANGLVERTFFYPGVLLREEYANLPAHGGILGRSAADLRAAIRTALGIGSGSCLHPGAPPRSRRGRIVVLEKSFAAALRTPFAVLLTEHVYSREKRYQVFVPILRGDGRVADPSVLTLTPKPWFGVFNQPTRAALLPVQVTQSAWYEDDIVHETRYVLDEDSLAALDSRLCTFFELEPESGRPVP